MPSALSTPRLRRIVGAYAVNRLGTWIGTIALSLAVYDRTHSALSVAATLLAAQVIPALVVPPLVARAEASRRRHELSGLYFFEAVTTAALAVLLWHFWLPAILLLVALDGTAALTASALLRTEAARAGRDGAARVGTDAQAGERAAAAAINVALSVTFVLGPVLGGLITAGPGASVALFIDAASFCVCGALLLDLHPHVEEAGGAGVAARLHAAWSYIQQAPALRALLLTQAVALVFFESAAPIEIAYAKDTLHIGDSGFGLLVTVWGLGAVAGAILFARASRLPLGALISAGTLAVGLAYIGFAASPSLLPACISALVGGIGNGVQWAPLISAAQHLTPPALQGRVMGAVESIGALCPAVGLALGGALVALGNPRFAFYVVGAGAAFATVAFALVTLDERSGLDSDVARDAGVLQEQPERDDRAVLAEPASS